MKRSRKWSSRSRRAHRPQVTAPARLTRPTAGVPTARPEAVVEEPRGFLTAAAAHQELRVLLRQRSQLLVTELIEHRSPPLKLQLLKGLLGSGALLDKVEDVRTLAFADRDNEILLLLPELLAHGLTLRFQLQLCLRERFGLCFVQTDRCLKILIVPPSIAFQHPLSHALARWGVVGATLGHHFSPTFAHTFAHGRTVGVPILTVSAALGAALAHRLDQGLSLLGVAHGFAQRCGVLSEALQGPVIPCAGADGGC